MRRCRTGTALNRCHRVSEHFRIGVSEEPGRSRVVTARLHKHRGCTGPPVAPGRDTKRAHESLSEVSLRGEATLERDVRYRGLVGSEKLLRPLQSHRSQILVNGVSGSLLECAGKVVLAQARHLRQLIQVEFASEIRINEFTDTL